VGTWLGTGWLSPRDAGTYHPLASMLKSGLPFLTDGWDGSLYSTARAGAKGTAVSLVTETEVRLIRRYEQDLGISLQCIRVLNGEITSSRSR